jgi:hypothetical protein
MYNTWIEEQEAKLRREEDIALANGRTAVEEITRAKGPSFRHRVARALRGREHNRYEEAKLMAPAMIVESDPLGSRYVVYHPGSEF